MVLDIIVRQACGLDISSLVKYNQLLAKETENISLDKEILRLGVENALNNKGCQYIVAELNDNVVGQTLITSEWSDWRNGLIWWLQSVYVHPDYRKRGVFNSIYNYIETLAKADPTVKGLRLYVMKDNLIGLNTYQSIGMINSGYLVYEKFDLSHI